MASHFMKVLKYIFAILLIVFLAMYAASPYYTAYQLKNAYDDKNGALMVGYIDFDQLQPNLKDQLITKFGQTLQQYPLVAQLGGEALTQASNEFINASVNKAITADNITQLVDTQGQANQATKELAAAWAIASNKVNLQDLIQDIIVQRGDINAVIQHQMQQVMSQQADELQTHAESGVDSAKPKLSYCGLNCFTVSGQVKGYPLTLEMQREGLIDWKVVNVVLP